MSPIISKITKSNKKYLLNNITKSRSREWTLALALAAVAEMPESKVENPSSYYTTMCKADTLHILEHFSEIVPISLLKVIELSRTFWMAEYDRRNMYPKLMSYTESPLSHTTYGKHLTQEDMAIISSPTFAEVVNTLHEIRESLHPTDTGE